MSEARIPAVIYFLKPKTPQIATAIGKRGLRQSETAPRLRNELTQARRPRWRKRLRVQPGLDDWKQSKFRWQAASFGFCRQQVEIKSGAGCDALQPAFLGETDGKALNRRIIKGGE